MNEPLEELYFNWLCAKVIPVRELSPAKVMVFSIMHSTEFVWLIIGDDNRAEDGLNLRSEFLIAADIPDNEEWRSIGCSVFEMIIAFIRRAEHLTDEPELQWFWEFMNNLGLADFNDEAKLRSGYVEDILHRFVWRTYEYNGVGGMLPIRKPKSDQRILQIWFQFCDYLEDTDRIPLP